MDGLLDDGLPYEHNWYYRDPDAYHMDLKYKMPA